jgi:hypothetical protein
MGGGGDAPRQQQRSQQRSRGLSFVGNSTALALEQPGSIGATLTEPGLIAARDGDAVRPS